MSALKNYIFVICLASTYARIPYIDFLVGTRCINKANETGICEFYENCQHLLDKFKKHQINQEDIFKCNEQGIICCTPDAPITSTTKASVIRFANDHEVNKVGKISEESKEIIIFYICGSNLIKTLRKFLIQRRSQGGEWMKIHPPPPKKIYLSIHQFL